MMNVIHLIIIELYTQIELSENYKWKRILIPDVIEDP